MEKQERIILVTNDDGITAPGIRALIEAVRPLGKVVVVAPDSPQSGMGHAITIGVPLRLNQVDIFGDIEAWQCSGTPVDCVKLARDKILHRKPDICVSGINHGANHSINVIYSGTMSAAMEAAIEGIPSAGFSFLEYSYDADFSLPASVAREMTERILNSELPAGSLFNVNIPVVDKKDFKGLRLCRQADAKWVEEFDERRDPHGKKYYWLTGEFKNRDVGEDTDVWALENNYASVVPVQFDLTNYRLMKKLEESWKEF
ncbi:5'/3'-nucleotidase SurE [Chitinophaga qingshengii]|uniref:5'-nucleotidase SurE n=1 Tax=Chitinophaga qingshengii TaxID=1569794 RepID=A0ABR7TK65_9BACT|nr:5'/3'-nucleotidase SurE [Chitinophaga qingshengii]MBC9930844.1 5'/3'-nucleotidase SurE [Chitinophaga qingshengii]